jgi:FMN reductase
LTIPQPFIVGIGGTTRAGSTSELALRATLAHAEALGARTALLCATELVMDAYDPMVKTRSASAQRLVQLLREADGIVIASPSYHGSIPGLLKNALDYTEDMRSDERPYFDGRAVGCVVCAEGIQAMGTTLFTLRSIVHALRGWPTPYCAKKSSRPNSKPWPNKWCSSPISACRPKPCHNQLPRQKGPSPCRSKKPSSRSTIAGCAFAAKAKARR